MRTIQIKESNQSRLELKLRKEGIYCLPVISHADSILQNFDESLSKHNLQVCRYEGFAAEGIFYSIEKK